MSAPPIPPSLEIIGRRPFSFYPPIVNVEHNEWRFARATWSEILVTNTKSAEEIWISRRFLAELSRVDEPVMILGLTKELEYRGGQVLPHVRRVIEMPRAVNDTYRTGPAEPPASPAPVVGIRLEGGAESRVGKLILTALVIGLLGCVAVIGFFRIGRDGSHIAYSPVLQSDLNLSGTDEYPDVVRKMGPPSNDHWKSDNGAMQYRVLRYDDRSIFVVLMGEDREKARYIGSLDKDWRPVHSVSMPGGRNTASMLRSLPRF
jgi:hypothetical protein